MGCEQNSCGHSVWMAAVMSCPHACHAMSVGQHTYNLTSVHLPSKFFSNNHRAWHIRLGCCDSSHTQKRGVVCSTSHHVWPQRLMYTDSSRHVTCSAPMHCQGAVKLFYISAELLHRSTGLGSTLGPYHAVRHKNLGAQLIPYSCSAIRIPPHKDYASSGSEPHDEESSS
jgi:hypothetical protein